MPIYSVYFRLKLFVMQLALCVENRIFQVINVFSFLLGIRAELKHRPQYTMAFYSFHRERATHKTQTHHRPYEYIVLKLIHCTVKNTMV